MTIINSFIIVSKKYFINLNPKTFLFRLIHKQTLFLQTILFLLIMKKLGILLLAFTLWMGANAETKKNPDTTGTSKTVIGSDSLQKLYMSDKLSPKEAILLQKLSADQIMKLEEDRLARDKMNDMPFDKFGLLLICIAPFIMAVLIIYFTSVYKNRESIRKHELYMKALEAGQTIPENYFKEQEKAKTSNLQKGAIWLAVGLALVISKFATQKDIFILGIVPAFIGAAFLFVYFIEKTKNQLPENNE